MSNHISHSIKIILGSCSGKPGTQKGAVLIVSLIVLLLMTLIGTTGMQVTSLEEKMAGNMRDRNLAFQAAESALAAGEQWLDDSTNTFTCSASAGRFMPQDNNCDNTKEATQVWDNINWDNTDSVAYTGTLSNLNANPRYIIEDMGACSSPCPSGAHSYRITARATGGSADTIVILQSIYQI